MPQEGFLGNKLPVWDLGGTLNQLDPPSEQPPNDVIDINNWKVHKDGRSRVKRPGYSKLDTGYSSLNSPIKGIFEYEDANNDQHIVMVSRDEIVQREEVYTWTQQFRDTDGDYTLGWRQPLLYQDKVIMIDHGPAATDEQILGSTDGATFAALDSGAITATVAHGWGVATLNDEILYGLYAAAIGNNLIRRWDGATTFTSELASPDNGTYVQHLHNWDGKTWILLYANGGSKYLVYNWNGASYSAIGNYDGGADVPTNSAQKIINDVSARMARFFTWNNQLYLFVTIKDLVSAKWNFQIWRFNETLYDRFTMIYDNDGVADDYGFCSIYEYDGSLWVILQKLDYAGDANPDGDDNKIYSSENMTTWTLENGSMALGCVMGEEVFEGKVFINTLWDFAGSKHTKLWYWDKGISNFVAEQIITSDVPPGNESTGDLIIFNGELYVFKYREVYKRALSTNTYGTIHSSMETIDNPVGGAYWHHRYMLAMEGNLVLEGSDVYSLGITAPIVGCTAAAVEITIGAGNNKIDFEETGATPLVATLTNASYTTSELCTEIKTQLEAAGGSVYTVTYNEFSLNLFRITSDGAGGGGIFTLLCNTGANKANAVWDTIGFDDSADKSGFLIYIGDDEEVYLTGAYEYLVTFRRSGNYPVESNPSPASTSIIFTGQKGTLTAIPVSADPKVNQRRLYRSTAGGTRYYWLDDIDDNTTTTYALDEINDDTLLGGDEVSYDRLPPPAGKYFEVWDSRLFIGGITEYPHMVMFTNTNTSEEMASTNFLQFRVKQSETMKQIKVFGDMLFVFFETVAFRVNKVGASYYEVEELPQNIGVLASWSVAVCDTSLVWLSEFGIEVFNGNRCFRPIPSRYVKEILKTINRDCIDKIIGGHYFGEGEYWLAIPTGTNTEPDTVIVLDVMKKSFTVYTFPTGVTYLTAFAARQEGLVFLTGTDDGYVYIQGDGYDDDGTAISSHFQQAWLHVANERELANVLRRMFIKYICPASHSITMAIYSNYDKTAILTKTLSGSTPTDQVVLRNEILARVNMRVYGTHVSFKFTQNTKTGAEVKIEGFNLYFNRKLFRGTVTGD